MTPLKPLILLISLFFAVNIVYAQSPTFTVQMNMAQRRAYADSTAKMPTLNTNRTFATNRDSIGQYWMRPDSAKMFIRLPGNTIQAVTTEDSLRSALFRLPNHFIQNTTTPQTANYSITGDGVIGNTLAIGTTSLISGTLLNVSKLYSNATNNVVGERITPQASETVATHAFGLTGAIIQPTITGANNKNWSGGAFQGLSVAPTISSGATGLISNAYGIRVTKSFNASGSTVDTFYYRSTYPSMVATPTPVNNEIFDLVGISGGIGGQWSRYDASGYNSYWGTGNQLVNSFTDNGFGEKIQVNGRINASPATRSTNVVIKSQLDSLATASSTNFIRNQNTVSQSGQGFWTAGSGRIDGNILRVGNTSDVTDYISLERSTVDGVLRVRDNTSTPGNLTVDAAKFTLQDNINSYNPIVVDNFRVAIDSQVSVTQIGYTAATQPAITDSVKLFVKGNIITGSRLHSQSTGDLNMIGRNALSGRLEYGFATQKDGPAGAPGQEFVIGRVPAAVASSFAKLYVGDSVTVGGGYHGIGAYDVVQSSDAALGAYAAIDARTQFVGSTNANHYVGVQSRTVLGGSVGLSNYWYGVEGLGVHNGTGVVARWASLYANTIQGTGPVTLDYGIYIPTHSRGTSDSWQIYSETGKHFFGGDVRINGTGTAATLTVNGGYAGRIVTVTGTSYSPNALDWSIICTNTGVVTITLPDATAASGRIYQIKKGNNSVNPVNINTTSSQNVDAATTAAITTAYGSLIIVSNGTQWYIL